MRSVDERSQLVDLFSGKDVVEQDGSGSRTADGAVADEFHAPVRADARIVGRDFDRKARSRVIARSVPGQSNG